MADFLILLGLAGMWYAFSIEQWFGPLDRGKTLRRLILAVVSLTLASQLGFANFFVSVLGLRRE